MVKFIRQGVYYAEGRLIKESQAFMTSDKKARAIRNTASYAVLSEYFRGEELSLPVSRVAMGEEEAKNVFCTLDAMGIRELPVPCAVFASAWGDPDFLFSASKRYGVRVVTGGLYPAEGYVREQLVRTGEILLGTQYFPCGALGALSVVDDEGAVLRTLMGAPYAVPKPATAAVYIKGKLRKGVGPTDVALSILKTLMTSDIAEGKLLEVFGPGLSDLSMDSRNQIDSWLRRTGCFGTLWAADGKTKGYFEVHARGEDYKSLAPAEPAYYDCGAVVDLSRIEPMIAFRGHIFPVREAMEDPAACGLCAEGETPRFTDFRIGGMCGTYETLAEVAEIVREKHIGADANFTVLPVSAPVEQALMQNGYAAALLSAGILTGRNFGGHAEGLFAADRPVSEDRVLLDARTLAYTALCGGKLCSAQECAHSRRFKKYTFDGAYYATRVFLEVPEEGAQLDFSHGTEPLPATEPLPEDLTLKIASVQSSPQDEEEPEIEAETKEEDTMSAFAVLYTDHAEGAEWGQAIEMRAKNFRAVLAKTFSEKLKTHLADWGILPLVVGKADLKAGDEIALRGVRAAVSSGGGSIVASVVSAKRPRDILLTIPALSEAERAYILCGSRVAARREQ